MPVADARCPSETLAVILAGGSATRLGGTKAGLLVGDGPLIGRPVRAGLDAGLETIVVAKEATAVPPLGVRVHREPASPLHPLLGIVTGLELAGGRAIVALACDMPFVTSDLLAWLAAQPGTVIPSVGGSLEPLCARYAPEALLALRAAAEAGEPAQRTVAGIATRVLADDELTRFGDPHRIFFNVNTAADLAKARGLADGETDQTT